MGPNDDYSILEAIVGFIAFIALMQLFPICIRLGKIRDNLRYMAADRERIRKLSGDKAVWNADTNEFDDPTPEDKSWYRESPSYKEAAPD